MPEPNYLRRFLTLVFALLVPGFTLWALFSAVLAVPAVGLVNMALTAWFPEVIEGLFMQGAEALLLTNFGEMDGELVDAREVQHRLGFVVDTRLLSYSVPFYAALHFATRKDKYLESFFMGVLLLYMLMIFGLVCLCLRELGVNLGAAFTEQEGVFVPNINVIAMLYQVNVLIVPTLAPVLIWGWQSRDTPLIRELPGIAKLNPGNRDSASGPDAHRRAN